MKKRLYALIITTALLLTCGCTKAADISVTATVTKDEKYGTAVVSLSQREFEQAGFRLGDSCNIEFGNGYRMKDVPYYNGYYVKTGDSVVVAYPGFQNIGITLNNVGIWDKAELEENMSVEISLNSAGKYAPIQDSLGQEYSFSRSDYDSDTEFANFRELSGGHLKPGCLFRGASPVDNSRGRATFADALLREHGIGFVLDLADSEEEMKEYIGAEDFASEYTAELYRQNKVALLAMSSSYQSDEYRQKLVEGLRQLIASEDCPVYIHCMEGKDRTGFVCMLLEALAGAGYDEMLNDYMITYSNYYSVSKEETPEKYDAIAKLYFDSFVEYLYGSSDIRELQLADYYGDAAKYLRDGGMSDAEIQALVDRIAQ